MSWLYHSPFSPTVLPVVGLTRCISPHARQVRPTKISSPAPSDSSSSGAKPCTRSPVFGQRKMNGGIQPMLKVVLITLNSTTITRPSLLSFETGQAIFKNARDKGRGPATPTSATWSYTADEAPPPSRTGRVTSSHGDASVTDVVARARERIAALRN
jgi:hypothetical protein